MAKYLVFAKYTQDGAKGLLKGGGTARRAAVEKSVTGLGARLDSFYFTFGKEDAVLVIDLPDHASMAALSLAVGAAGGASTRTQVLLTPEELDQASKTSVEYRAPGS